MHILFLTRRFYPSIGGVEKHVYKISKELLKKNHSITVVTEMPEDFSSPEREEYEGITILRISTGKENWFKKFRIWKEMWRIRSSILSTNIIHCHDIFFWYLPFRFLYSSKPIYTTFHGYEGYPITKKAILTRKISERLSRRNICIGSFIKKWYGTKPTYIMYGAVTLQISKSPGINMKKQSAIFIGRLVKENGIILYGKAMELLLQRLPQFSFRIIGDGPLRKNLPKSISQTGFQLHPEEFFPQYHFAFVSGYLSILEAFAAKRLVFAVYDNPLKKDYLEMTPFRKFMIITHSPEELREKVLYYLSNPEEEKKIIKDAYRWVQKQTWENMANLYIKLWKMQ